MTDRERLTSTGDGEADWHRLLAPLPASAIIRRQPVGAAAGLDPASPIDGWEQFVIELADGFDVRRILQVVTDGAGVLVSAGDHVMTVVRAAEESMSTGVSDVPEAGTELYYHESVGGRFEPEGDFLGTHWRTWSVLTGEDDAGEDDSVAEAGPGTESLLPAPEKRPATADEARELRRLAIEMLVRAGVRS